MTSKHATKEDASKEDASESYLSEVTTIVDNIPYIIWSSLSVYPEIQKAFDNLSIKYLAQATEILAKNSGGFVRRIEYLRMFPRGYRTLEDNITLYSALKHTTVADNLFYEYLVGACCINNLTFKFPTFIHTYGIYTINTEILPLLRRKKILSGDTLRPYLKPVPISTVKQYSKICNMYPSFGLVIQYCNDFIDIGSFWTIPNYRIELLLTLFQIYYTLAQCRHIFTHYDLHLNNAGVITLPKNTCIKYIYEFVDINGISQTVRFTSGCIVKIIDYGRCRFSGMLPNGDDIDSRELLKHIKYTPECNPLKKHGFHTLPLDFVIPSEPNHSHDLRLLNELKDAQDVFRKELPILNTVLSRVKYDSEYGTPHMENSNTTRIYTVSDASNVLFDTITRINPKTRMSIVSSSDKLYSTHKCIGTIHVRGITKNMEFIPNHTNK